MRLESVVKPLSVAFSSLSDKQLRCLHQHVRQRTPFYLGRDYFVNDGAIAPEVAASTRSSKPRLTEDRMAYWASVYQQLCSTGQVLTIPALYTAEGLKPYTSPSQPLTSYSAAIGRASLEEFSAAVLLACHEHGIG